MESIRWRSLHDTIYGPGGTPANDDSVLDDFAMHGCAWGSCPCDAAQHASDRFYFSARCEESVPDLESDDLESERQTDNIIDPWGTPYVVRIDGGYNNQVANPYTC